MSSDILQQWIAAELRSLPEGEWSWGQVACVLDYVERTNYWQSTGSSSFTEGLSVTLGVKAGTLWRYLSAGRFYASSGTNSCQQGYQLRHLKDWLTQSVRRTWSC